MDFVCASCEKENQNCANFINDTDTAAPTGVIDIKVNARNFIIQRTKNVFDFYIKMQFLGKGAFGSVYKVERKNSGTREIIRALKEISKEAMNVNEENQKEPDRSGLSPRSGQSRCRAPESRGVDPEAAEESKKMTGIGQA